MPTTRAKTGNSKPRVVEPISTAPVRKTTGKTSKPRAKKVTTGRVGKSSSTKPETKVKKAATKAKGVVKKAEGAVEGKPGKKVCLEISLLLVLLLVWVKALEVEEKLLLLHVFVFAVLGELSTD